MYTKFGQNWPTPFRGDVENMKSYFTPTQQQTRYDQNRSPDVQVT